MKGFSSAVAGSLERQASDPTVLQGVVDETVGAFTKGHVPPPSTGLEVPGTAELAKAKDKLKDAQQGMFRPDLLGGDLQIELASPKAMAEAKAKLEAAEKRLAGAATPSFPEKPVATPPPLTQESLKPQMDAVKAKLMKAEERLKGANAPSLKTPGIEVPLATPPPVTAEALKPQIAVVQAKLERSKAKMEQERQAANPLPAASEVPATPPPITEESLKPQMDIVKAKMEAIQKKLDIAKDESGFHPPTDPMAPLGVPPPAPLPKQPSKLQTAKSKLEAATQRLHSATQVAQQTSTDTVEKPPSPEKLEQAMAKAKAELQKAQSLFNSLKPKAPAKAPAAPAAPATPEAPAMPSPDDVERSAEILAEQRIAMRRLDIHV